MNEAPRALLISDCDKSVERDSANECRQTRNGLDCRRALRFLKVRRPALFVFAAPALHRFSVVADLGVSRVELQGAISFPCDVGKLKHGDGDVTDGDGRIELFAFADSGDEIGKVQIGHGITAGEISGGGLLLTGFYL